MLAPKGCGRTRAAAQPSNMLPHEAALRCCASRRSRRGTNTGNQAATHQRCLYGVCIHPLGRGAEQWRPKEIKTAECLSEASFRLAPSGIYQAAEAAQGTDAKHRRQTGFPSITRHACGQENISVSRSSAKPKSLRLERGIDHAAIGLPLISHYPSLPSLRDDRRVTLSVGRLHCASERSYRLGGPFLWAVVVGCSRHSHRRGRPRRGPEASYCFDNIPNNAFRCFRSCKNQIAV